MTIFREEAPSTLTVFQSIPLYMRMNWNLKMFIRRKTSEQGKNQQRTQPKYDTGPELNPAAGHIGWRRAPSPLHYPCFLDLHVWQWLWLLLECIMILHTYFGVLQVVGVTLCWSSFVAMVDSCYRRVPGGSAALFKKIENDIRDWLLKVPKAHSVDTSQITGYGGREAGKSCHFKTECN